MLLHAERPLGISLRILPLIQVFKHALAFASACAKFYETYMIACTAYSIFKPNQFKYSILCLAIYFCA